MENTNIILNDGISIHFIQVASPKKSKPTSHPKLSSPSHNRQLPLTLRYRIPRVHDDRTSVLLSGRETKIHAKNKPKSLLPRRHVEPLCISHHLRRRLWPLRQPVIDGKHCPKWRRAAARRCVGTSHQHCAGSLAAEGVMEVEMQAGHLLFLVGNGFELG